MHMWKENLIFILCFSKELAMLLQNGLSHWLLLESQQSAFYPTKIEQSNTILIQKKVTNASFH